jgi:hypothetical protein
VVLGTIDYTAILSYTANARKQKWASIIARPDVDHHLACAIIKRGLGPLGMRFASWSIQLASRLVLPYKVVNRGRRNLPIVNVTS